MPTRLELTWINKHHRPRLEPRILLERPEHSHAASSTAQQSNSEAVQSPLASRSPSSTPNLLLHGDNLLALKALEPHYTAKVKCICIDPPYNTGSAFTHYDDGLEHSTWLSLMRDRLEIMRQLLRDDGSIWVFVDDSEAHYLKVMMDEIFGRGNFISNVIWQKRTSRENRAAIGSSTDHLLVYAKSSYDNWKSVRNRLPATEEGYSNPDNDSAGDWRSIPFSAQGYRPNQMYTITTPTGKIHEPPKGRCWGGVESTFEEYLAAGKVYFPKNGDGKPRIKQYRDDTTGLAPMSLWLASEVGDNQESKKESNTLFGATEAFATPKPERLIRRILTIATNPGDLVLDSFAGSGTTGAVAHKMGRRWIMCELGDHAFTHIVPRMCKVIDGQDPGGVTETTGWAGGGSFRTYELAPTLMSEDLWGNRVINPIYNPEMLAQAMCLHEGFAYAPSQERFWEHGHSTESDFVYVTTQTLTVDQLRALSEEVGPEASLLVLCSAWTTGGETFDNLSLRKIPNSVLARCEWGNDDYSLDVEAVSPGIDEADDEDAPHRAAPGRNATARKAAAQQPGLFATAEATPISTDDDQDDE